MSDESTPFIGEVSALKGINALFFEVNDLKDGDTCFIYVKRDNVIGIPKSLFKLKVIDKEKGLFEIKTATGELGPEQERQELAELITKVHRDEIMHDSVGMVYKALMRKPVGKLRKLAEQTKKGAKAKLRTGPGCVFLEIGDEKESEDTVL